MSPSLLPGSILDTFQYLGLLVGWEQIGHFTCHITLMLMIIVVKLMLVKMLMKIGAKVMLMILMKVRVVPADVK